MPDPFHCILVTPEREVFSGEITYANLPAHDGQLGVQHGRAPLLAELGHGKLRLDTPGGGGGSGGTSEVFAISGGFFKVNDNKLSILTDEAYKPGEIDAERARADLAKALDAPARNPNQQKRRQSGANRARALLTVADQAPTRKAG